MVEGTVRSFEDLFAWKKARELANVIYIACDDGPLSKDYGLRDQLRRAAISVMSNIAEGFERATTPDFIHFLYIAKGSAGEIRSQLYLARDRTLISQTTFETSSSLARETSSVIFKLIQSLKEKQSREADKKTRRRTVSNPSLPQPVSSEKNPVPAPFTGFGDPFDY